MNKQLTLVIGLLVTIIFSACNKDDIDDINPDGITYEVTFTGNWTALNHPLDYPSNPHFSPLVGLSHGSDIELFSQGGSASAGMKNMAETGGTSPLTDEIRNLINNNIGFDLVLGGGLSTGTASTTVEVVVNETHSEVSLVSMVAPSPDWFVAVKNLNLMRSGSFVADTTLNAVSWDAGTDSGTSYTSADEATAPAEGIDVIVAPPLGNDSAMQVPAAIFRFVRK